MGFILKLIHGSKSIDLNSAPYAPDNTFVPPEMSSTVQMSTGAGRNKAGGREISRKPRDRSFEIPLRIDGTTTAQTHAAVSRLTNFMRRALDDKSDPLYLVYGPSDAVPYEPAWGQLFYYYEIRSFSDPYVGRFYETANLRQKTFFTVFPLIIGPYATGKEQLVGSATGGILEHAYATPDGASRGLHIPPAGTNLVTNPVFGNATFDTGWTTGSDLISSVNTDPEYILFGDASAKLTADGPTNRGFSINVTCAASTHAFSWYIKKHDNSAVTTSDIQLGYNAGALTETYTPIGNGWYMVWATETGTGGAATMSVSVAAGLTAYIGLVQAEARDYPSAPFYGDMVGCAWSSTAHDSTSTRTVARYQLPAGTLNDNRKTVRFAWRAPVASTTLPSASYRFWYDATTGARVRWSAASNYWVISDGTNAYNSAATSFAAGDLMVMHAVYQNGAVTLYKNGVSIATGTTYLPATTGILYLGSSEVPSEHPGGTYLDFMLFDQALSATQVLNDATNLIAQIGGGDGLGKCVNPIPWLWSTNGDSTIEGCYDASTRENFLAAGGIPGNAPAETEWLLTPAQTASALGLSVQKYNYSSINMTRMLGLFEDLYGTVDGGASDCGGQVKRETVTTATTTITNDPPPHIYAPEQKDRDYTIFFRIKDAGSDLQARMVIADYAGSSVLYASEWKSIDPPSASYKLMSTGPVGVSSIRPGRKISSSVYSAYLQLRRTTGTGYVYVDYQIALPEPTCHITGGMAGLATYSILGKTCYAYTSGLTTSIGIKKIETTGSIIELSPNGIDFIFALIELNQTANDIDDTVALSITITPRWELI